jgi:hypothetical protein
MCQSFLDGLGRSLLIQMAVGFGAAAVGGLVVGFCADAFGLSFSLIALSFLLCGHREDEALARGLLAELECRRLGRLGRLRLLRLWLVGWRLLLWLLLVSHGQHALSEGDGSRAIERTAKGSSDELR